MTQVLHPIDIHVGKRIRIRRKLLGLTQRDLAEHLGLTFQQIQKYESAANRISAGRLYDLARILSVPISYFFDDLSEPLPKLHDLRGAPKAVKSYQGSRAGFGLNHKRETLELVRAYHKIAEPGLRKQLLVLAKGLSATSADTPTDLPPPSMLLKLS